MIIEFSEDEADLAMRAIAWAAIRCDAEASALTNNTVKFACRHTRDRCNVLAKKFADALGVQS